MLIKTISRLAHNRVPGQVVIQYTEVCNAACPQCGMRKSNKFNRSTMDFNKAKKIIDHAATHGVSALSFTGGEPFLYFDEIMRLIDHASSAGIRYIRTGTNGFLFQNHNDPDFEHRIETMALALARTNIYTFWISVDSSIPSMHEKMRGLPGVMEGIGKALPIFHKHGLYPSANLGINRNIGSLKGITARDPKNFYREYRAAFGKFFDLMIDIGFTIVNACYPMSIESGNGSGLNAVYAATSEAVIVNFTSREKSLLYKALADTIPEYRRKIRIFSPRSALLSLSRSHAGEPESPYPCRGGIDFFFVDAKNGETYPCGYKGGDKLGNFTDLDISKNGHKASCRDCDWECFRDPSELFGPLQELFGRPASFISRFWTDRENMKVWLTDLKYYRACNFFNGRKKPNYKKLAAFQSAS
ncbi:MAG TPA: radical SAM protein [Nitrospirae bacterium]|nr:radical SAM protein [Nitrospirota bacterium]